PRQLCMGPPGSVRAYVHAAGPGALGRGLAIHGLTPSGRPLSVIVNAVNHVRSFAALRMNFMVECTRLP
ncbi:MAG: hypothetical protein RL077_6342, partial [Verrucomicrobiota bacterium]